MTWLLQVPSGAIGCVSFPANRNWGHVFAILLEPNDAISALLPGLLSAPFTDSGAYCKIGRHPSAVTRANSGRSPVPLPARRGRAADDRPVAIDFGPDGCLWVCEMHDYPSGLHGNFEPGGRVRILRDDDGDGVYDRSTIFLDGLPFPTGVTVWRKGVLVCAAPDILYAEDTDGDDRADVRRVAVHWLWHRELSGPREQPTYGLDGWVYGACGLFGGDIRSHITGKTTRLAIAIFGSIPIAA